MNSSKPKPGKEETVHHKVAYHICRRAIEFPHSNGFNLPLKFSCHSNVKENENTKRTIILHWKLLQLRTGIEKKINGQFPGPQNEAHSAKTFYSAYHTWITIYNQRRKAQIEMEESSAAWLVEASLPPFGQRPRCQILRCLYSLVVSECFGTLVTIAPHLVRSVSKISPVNQLNNSNLSKPRPHSPPTPPPPPPPVYAQSGSIGRN